MGQSISDSKQKSIKHSDNMSKDKATDQQHAKTTQASDTIGQQTPISEDEIKSNIQVIVDATAQALLPLQQIVNNYQEIEQEVLQAVATKLLGINPDDIITPSTSFLSPLIEGYLLVIGEPERADLYLNLLATALDKNTAPMASLPSICNLLRELSGDEVKIISLFKEQEVILPIVDVIDHSVKQEEGGIEMIKNFSFISANAKCEYAGLLPLYTENLIRLGIIDVLGRYPDAVYQEIEKDEFIVNAVKLIAKKPGRKFIVNKKAPRLTTIGMLLLRTCVLEHAELYEHMMQGMEKVNDTMGDIPGKAATEPNE
jgi:hypothetical protein